MRLTYPVGPFTRPNKPRTTDLEPESNDMRFRKIEYIVDSEVFETETSLFLLGNIAVCLPGFHGDLEAYA
jgi:hypothetical protein